MRHRVRRLGGRSTARASMSASSEAAQPVRARALDAQLRGLSTVLIEAGDFASATSSRSTKLIHGGIRYLQEAVTDLDPGQYNVVKRALQERRIMLDNARFLAHPMEFLVPCYSRWEVFYYGVGSKIYDRIAGKHNFFPSRYRSAQDSLARWPLLQGNGLKGTIAYADGQFDDARYCVALVQTFTRGRRRGDQSCAGRPLAAGCRRKDLRGGDRRPAHRRAARRCRRESLRQLLRARTRTTFAPWRIPTSRSGCG